MGIEYAAKFGVEGGAPKWSDAFDFLVSLGEWVELERSESKIVLAYAGVPLRTVWPDDVVIEGGVKGVYVLFHAGTGMQRTRLLSVLEEFFRKQGVMLDFEEL